MTSRERVVAALNHTEPDTVPIEMEATVGFYNKLRAYLHLKRDLNPKIGIWTEVPCDTDMLRMLGLDIVRVGPNPPKTWQPAILPDGSFTDEWGVVYKKTYYGKDGGYYNERVKHPLENATVDDLNRYPWPDPEDESRVSRLREKVKNLFENTDFAIMLTSFGALFETAEYMRGQEQWLMDLILNPNFAHALLDKLCTIELKVDKLVLEAAGKYVQIFHVGGEDLGAQNGPLISPQTYRDIVKPYHRRRWTAARKLFKQINPQGKIALHSCGSIYSFIQDFIDCGIEMLDPIQPFAKGMESSRLKKEFGDRLTFNGAIDIQRILPFGTTVDVKNEVKSKIADLAPGGGYILRAAHYIPDDVPPENFMAMIEAAKEYGKYPLEL